MCMLCMCMHHVADGARHVILVLIPSTQIPVFVMTPPMNTPVRGGRDDRGVPYHAESTLSSAQVLKKRKASARGQGKASERPRISGYVEAGALACAGGGTRWQAQATQQFTAPVASTQPGKCVTAALTGRTTSASRCGRQAIKWLFCSAFGPGCHNTVLREVWCRGESFLFAALCRAREFACKILFAWCTLC